MQRSEKEEVIKELNGKFSQVKTAIVATFSKLDVETVTRLRKKMRDGGAEYRVLKNTLAKLAAKGTSVEVVADDFVGPVALVMSATDPVAPAKILTEFLKDLNVIVVKSAVVDGKKIDKKGVEQLAKMPGLPELRAKLLGLLTQPATKLVRTIKEPGGALARVVQAYADKK